MDKPAKGDRGGNALRPEDMGYSDQLRADVRARFAELAHDAHEIPQYKLPYNDEVLHALFQLHAAARRQWADGDTADATTQRQRYADTMFAWYWQFNFSNVADGPRFWRDRGMVSSGAEAVAQALAAVAKAAKGSETPPALDQPREDLYRVLAELMTDADED